MRWLLAALLLAAAPASAQAPSPVAQAQAPRPAPPNPRRAELDRLLDELARAPDSEHATIIETRIRSLWAQGASAAVTLLMRRGLRNLAGNAPDEAVEDFDAAIALAPNLADAFILRAQALASLGDARAAAADIQRALGLEPRHFGALTALAQILSEAGDHDGALRAFEAALALNPRMQDGPRQREEYRRRAEGEAM
jgi:tetratricopeptide (TPR) repeat protein